MDAIKKVLAPGKSQDDELMYGDRSNAGVSDSGSGQFTQGVPQDATLHTLPESEKKSHGILKQIFKPKDSYDEEKYGSTATTDASAVPQHPTDDKSDHGILRQIVNPKGEKYDETRHGKADEAAKSTNVAGGPATATTATNTTTTTTTTQPTHATTTSTTQPTHATSATSQPSQGTTTSSSAVPTGATSTTDYGSTAVPPSTTTYNQGSSNPSHLERDAAIGGAGLAGAGALAYGANKDQHHDTTDSDRSFPLSGGAATTSHDTQPPASAASSTYSQPASGVNTVGAGAGTATAPARGTESAYNRPTTTDSLATTGSSTTSTPAQHDHRAAETAALGGASAAALGAGGLAAHEHEHSHQPHITGQQTSSSTASQGLSHHVHNDGSAPTSGDASHEHRFATRPHDHSGAEALGGAALGASAAREHEHNKQHSGLAYHDPSATEGGLSHHVYNSVAGKHSAHGSEGTVSTALPASGAGSTVPSSTTVDPATSTSASQAHGHHHGAEAAGVGAGALGVAGLAQRGLAKHENDQHTSQAPHIPGEFPSESSAQPIDQSGFGTSTGPSAAAIAAQRAVASHGGPAAASTTTTSSSPSDVRGLANQEVGQAPHATAEKKEHHLGRDAALVGGGVAAGSAAAHHHHGDKEPSSTTGTTSTTAESHQKQSLLDKLDPRKKSDSATTEEKAEKNDHHPARGVAAVGGGIGAGAYAAEREHAHKAPSSTTDSTTAREPHQKESLLSKLDPRKKSDPATAEEKTEKKEHHPARDTALAGSAVAAGGYAAHEHHENKHPSSTADSTTEPHKESLLSKLNPLKKSDSTAHEKKADEKAEKKAAEKAEKKEHHPARDTAVAAGIGGAGYEATKHHEHKDPASTTASSAEPHEKQSLLSKLTPHHKSGAETEHAKESNVPETHTARNIGMFGGVGQAGLGGFEEERHLEGDEIASNVAGSTSQSKASTQPEKEQHHYGRDAGIAAGAGAAGVGIYDLGERQRAQQSDSGPASNTIGPHDSNIANVLDPRVQPQPEFMKKHSTVGPHQSDTLNKLDPHVTADPWKAQRKEKEHQDQHHDSRDAALAGGTTAAAGHAYDDRHHEEKLSEGKHHESEHHHNKLHKDPPSEKKEGFLHKLLHPGSKKDKHDASEASSSEATVTDPHTGLPVNVDKYGSGVGGTDGSQQIGGIHQHGQGETSADWDGIKKANTPY